MAEIINASEIGNEITDEMILDEARTLHDDLCVKKCDRWDDGNKDAWLFWAELSLRDQVDLDRELSAAIESEDS